MFIENSFSKVISKGKYIRWNFSFSMNVFVCVCFFLGGSKIVFVASMFPNDVKRCEESESEGLIIMQTCVTCGHSDSDSHIKLFCSDCKKVMCLECLGHASRRENCVRCQICYDRMLLRYNPRINFMPDAPIEIEYQFVNSVFNRKRALQQQQLMRQNECKRAKLEESSKSLLELSFETWPKIELNALALKHPHELDDSMWLDESFDPITNSHRHIYHVQYSKDGPFETAFNLSTSTHYSRYFQKFDKFEGLRQMFLGKSWGPKHEKAGKYYSDDDDVLAENCLLLFAEWNEAGKNGSQLGKFVHFLIECHCNGVMNFSDHPAYFRDCRIQQYLQWRLEYFDKHYTEYRTEFKFHTDAKLRKVGTCDLLAVRRNHPPPSESNDTLYVTMFDWKNTILDRCSYNGRRGIGCCESISDCNVGKYCVQQNDYKRLAAQPLYTNWKYNGYTYKHMCIEEMQLVAFAELNRNNKADREILPDIQDEVIAKMWLEREQEVTEWEQKGRPAAQRINYEQPTKEEELLKVKTIIRECKQILLENAEKAKQRAEASKEADAKEAVAKEDVSKQYVESSTEAVVEINTTTASPLLL